MAAIVLLCRLARFVDSAADRPVSRCLFHSVRGKWNTYEITAKGPHFVVVLNGQKTADVQDSKHAAGPFALQYGSRRNQVPQGAAQGAVGAALNTPHSLGPEFHGDANLSHMSGLWGCSACVRESS